MWNFYLMINGCETIIDIIEFKFRQTFTFGCNFFIFVSFFIFDFLDGIIN